MSATRRQFLKAGAAGSAALLVEVPLFARPETGAAPFVPNPWISIARDGIHQSRQRSAAAPISQWVIDCCAG